jgi:hypothetical protein
VPKKAKAPADRGFQSRRFSGRSLAAVETSNVSANADVSQPRLYGLERDLQLARDVTMRHWITSSQLVAHEERLPNPAILSAPLRALIDVQRSINFLAFLSESPHLPNVAQEARHGDLAA